MKAEKRNPHSYKCTDQVYKDAVKRAKKEKTPLAQMVEEIIEAYANGATSVSFIKPAKS